VVVCVTTTTPHHANDPGNVELDEGDADLPEASVVNVSQIIAVDKVRLMEWIGALSQDKMRTAEVAGSIPASPTLKTLLFAREN
jgi:mRNA interferase MazF